MIYVYVILYSNSAKHAFLSDIYVALMKWASENELQNYVLGTCSVDVL